LSIVTELDGRGEGVVMMGDGDVKVEHFD